jgi:hypothetical protein
MDKIMSYDLTFYNASFKNHEILEVFKRTNRKRCIYVNCDFGGVEFVFNTKLRGNFLNCNFNLSKFRGSIIGGEHYNSNFSEAVFNASTFCGPVFNNSSFQFSKFDSNIGVYTCKFRQDCILSEADGLKYDGPFDDSKYLDVRQHLKLSGVPEHVEREETEKMYFNEDVSTHEDWYEYIQCQASGRKHSTLPRRQPKFKNRYATLICTEGFMK